jgi:ribonuclease BN (tRNA processing enzyme)
MHLTILGSGTCVPSLKRSSCAALLEISHQKLLFDLGPGTIHRLLEAGITIFDITHIFLSHFHPDHTGELVSFLFSNKYGGGHLRRHPLTIIGGKGWTDFYNGLKQVYGHWIEPQQGTLSITEFDMDQFDTHAFDRFQVTACPVAHNRESLAYRITDPEGHSVVYSGDTDVSENLITLSKSVHVLVCESACPDHLKVAGHLTPSEAGAIGTKACVKLLVLTHFYPECDQVDMIAACRTTYDGELALAEDLMKIEIGNSTVAILPRKS